MTALGDHLWQSTVVVFAAALLSWTLRRNAARVRSWIWTAASAKFLIPFTVFIAIGGRIAWKPALQPQAQISFVLDAISQPLSRTAVVAAAAPRAADRPSVNGIVTAALAVWIMGTLLLAVRWCRAWLRVRRVSRRGEVLRSGREVDALAVVSGSSPTTLPIRLCDQRVEPGVFGVFRPVLLWPRGFGDRLTDAQLGAVIAHEVCHVRRRDNLVAAMHTVVETLFWYHPLVWWIGARLVDERERACDEAVVALGAAPEAYAEGILRTCEYYAESPLMSVSGITGSDLKKRIEGIMRPAGRARLTAARRLLLAAAAIGVIAVPLASGALAAAKRAPAQGIAPATAGQSPVFESAAVKPHPDGDSTTLFQALPGGAVNLINQTVRMLITSAYQTQDYKVVGGPAWLSVDRFDIVARANADAALPQRLAMVRSLLADRFGLVMHDESREMAVFALTVSKAGQLGPNLAKAVRDCSPQPAPRPPLADGRPACGTNAAPGRLRSGGVTIDAFANRLGTLPQISRPVINQTGLEGLFDIDIAFATEDRPAPDAVSIFTALQEQLGVKLEAARGPVDVLVIDHVEQPTDNSAEPARPTTWRMDETDHFDVFFQPSSAGQLSAIERDIERAYTSVATDLRHDLPFRPALIVFPSSAELPRGSSAQALAKAIGALPPEDQHILLASDVSAAARSDQFTRQIREIFNRDVAEPRRQAQASAPLPTAFDTASVKPCVQEPNTGGQRRPEYRVSPGRVTIECITLARIVYFAYAGVGNMSNPLRNDEGSDTAPVRGGPGWMQSDKYTITATAEGVADRFVLMGPMLRALLEDRFQLRTHRESEIAPMYALRIAKSGLKIRPIGDDGCTPFDEVKDLGPQAIVALDRGSRPVCGNFTSTGDGANRRWSLGATTLADFANNTLSSVLDRHVVDETGAPGRYNIQFEFGIDESIRRGVFGGAGVNPPPPDAPRGASIFTALQEQLGLTLEPTRGPRDFIVIDRVERPSPD